MSLRLKINVGTKKERTRFDILADTSGNVKKLSKHFIWLRQGNKMHLINLFQIFMAGY